MVARRCAVLTASVGFTVAGATLVAARLGGARGVGRDRASPPQRVGRDRAFTRLGQAYLWGSLVLLLRCVPELLYLRRAVWGVA